MTYEEERFEYYNVAGYFSLYANTILSCNDKEDLTCEGDDTQCLI